MKRKALLETFPCKFPVESEKVTPVAQIVQVGNEEILNIDLFYKGRREARYFASVNEKNYVAFVEGSWKRMKLHNVARVVQGKAPLKGAEYWYLYHECELTKEDKELAFDYLDAYSIEAFEDRANTEKHWRAMNRKAERIAEEMQIVDALDENVDEWLNKEVFPQNYLFVKTNKNRNVYTCTSCGSSSWRKKAFKQYESCKCPKCGQDVKVEKKKTERTEKKRVVVLQKADLPISSKWIERQFNAVCTWSEEGKAIAMHENIRAIIPKGQRYGRCFYGEYDEANEFYQEWWDKNTRNKRFFASYLYPGNLEEVLPYGKLEHSGIDVLANKGIKFNVNLSIVGHSNRPWTEYLIKSGFYKLAVEMIEDYSWYGLPMFINVDGKKLRDLLQIDGNRVNRLKELDGSSITLLWLQYEQANNTKITTESLRWLEKVKLKPKECSRILKIVKSVNRMVNYLKKQGGKSSLSTWEDYMKMAAEEGADLTDDIVRLPKDLRTRHDEYVRIRNNRLDKEKLQKYKEKYSVLDAKIQENIRNVKRYFWESKDYMIIPAGSCEELMNEGTTLHHCVGASDRYMNKMADNESWIMFLRRKTDLEKPYYTLEVNLEDDRILQWYSEYDRKPDKEIIEKVLNEYKKHLKKSVVAHPLGRIMMAAV